jgi:Cdc6-like AAA superfamily ATPase
MPFGSYLRVQLLAILTARLAALPWPVFDPAGLELVARKVSSSSGDVRKALQASAQGC